MLTLDRRDLDDQGQISGMMVERLEDQGLVENTGGETEGIPNAWRLTPRGKEIVWLSFDGGVLPSALEEEMLCTLTM